MQKFISENEQIIHRKKKLEEMINNGFDFPNDINPSNEASSLKKNYSQKTKEDLEDQHTLVDVYGRIMNLRIMGKASFIQIQDILL